MLRKIICLIQENLIVRASLVISGITMLVKIAGYAEKMLLAYYWGTGYEADAYNAVFAFIFSIFVFFREIIEPGFLHTFLKVKHASGEKKSWHVFFSVFWIIFPAGTVVLLCLFLFPDQVVHGVLPGFSGARFELTSGLIRYASFACIFMIPSTLTYITLTACKRFTSAAVGDLAFKLVIVAGILLLAGHTSIYSAIYGMVFGAAVKLAIHGIALRKFFFIENISGIRSSYVRTVWILAWPLLIGIIFSQISTLTDNVFASYLQEGSISALNYAKKVVELPVVIFPYAISIVVFPFFSELHIEKDMRRLRKLLGETLKWIAIVFIPLAILLFFFSDTVTQLIFQRGAFDGSSTGLTSAPLAVYALGMPAFAIETVLVIFYFSIADTKAPVFTGIGCVIINIAFTWILIRYVGYTGIAWGLVVSKTLKVIILLYLLKYRFNKKIKET
jgi:murein biosynthesis integral membrane protein MurJ